MLACALTVELLVFEFAQIMLCSFSTLLCPAQRTASTSLCYTHLVKTIVVSVLAMYSLTTLIGAPPT
jgi:hypothetical protein